MLTIKAEIKKSELKVDGTYNVKIRFTLDRKVKRLSTNLFITSKDLTKSLKFKEGNRERIQVFEGTVLKRQGGGARETFTVRKTSNGIGVEKTWPIHSPHVEKVEVIRRGKVRRAKLNYLRKRVGKAAKVKELVK